MSPDEPRRRTVLAGLGLAVSGVAGCLARANRYRGAETTTERATTTQRSPTRTPTATATPTPTPAVGAEYSWWTSRGSVLEGFEEFDSDWEVVGGTAAVTPAAVFGSAAPVTLESAGDRRLRIDREFDTPRDFRALEFSMGVQLHRTDKSLVQVELWLVDVDGAHRRLSGSIQPTAPDCWLRLDMGVREDGGADMGAIEEIRIVHWTGDAETAISVSDIRVNPKPAVGLVMFTFDDKGTDEYTEAFPILDEYGYAGACFPPIDRVTGESRPSIADYREMLDQGWDIGGHTLTHEDLTEYSLSEQRRIIEENFRRLRRKGLTGESNHFRTTYSNYDTNTLKVLPGPFDTAIIGNGSASGTNAHISDPRTIGFRSGDDLESAKADVDAAAKYRQLLGLTFHMANIDEDHLQRIADHVHRHEEAGRLRVVTPSELYDTYIRP